MKFIAELLLQTALVLVKSVTFMFPVFVSSVVSQVKEARRTLKKPQVEKFDCTEHKETFWCYCCGLEIERNVTDGNMTVLYGGLLEHMAT